MSKVENLIDQFEGEQQAIFRFFHDLFINEFGLVDKVTFGNPCYYNKSWICYLKPLKGNKVELAFMRGNELSNAQGLLESKGRKQLRSLELTGLNKLPLQQINEIIQEAILLDETIPYTSKRTKKE